MKEKKNIILTGLAAAVLIGGSQACSNGKPSYGQGEDAEKCFGVVKAGHNDCATDRHACATHSSADGDPNDWVSLPVGLCDKIVNGTTES